MSKQKVAILLFQDFETLDVFGPVEIFGRLTELYELEFYSMEGNNVNNAHNVSVSTKKINEIGNGPIEIFLIPGGMGTRREVKNEIFLDKIKEISGKSNYVLTVCTGSALLAKTGLLDGKTATSNKRAFHWVTENGENVNWNENARWTADGKYYTSAGVSAGMDMSLGFLNDRYGTEFARKVACEIEYNWVENKKDDTFKIQ